MKVHTIEQGSLEWHELRRGKITASKATTLMAVKGLGDGAKTYAKEIIMRRMGVELPTFTSDAMEYGIENEPFVREAYAIARKVEVDQVGFVSMDDEVGCSPDGLVGDDGMIEIKCPQPKAHFDVALTRKVPKQYMDQIQFSLMVTGRKWCDFISWNGDGFPDDLETIIIRVDRDDDYIEKMRGRIDEMKQLIKNIEDEITRFAN